MTTLPNLATPLLTSSRSMAVASDFAPSPGAPAIEVATEMCTLVPPTHPHSNTLPREAAALRGLGATRAVYLGKWLRCW
jgi:hypothetical protein